MTTISLTPEQLKRWADKLRVSRGILTAAIYGARDGVNDLSTDRKKSDSYSSPRPPSSTDLVHSASQNLLIVLDELRTKVGVHSAKLTEVLEEAAESFAQLDLTKGSDAKNVQVPGGTPAGTSTTRSVA